MKSLLKLLSLTAMIITFSCTKPSGEEPGGNDVQGDEQEQPQPQQPTVYTVGDYYKVGLSKGVVVSVDATGQHGVIISMNEAQKMWSIQPTIVFGAVDNTREDGQWNQEAIKGQATWITNWGNYTWDELFPAFFWCSSKNVGDLNSWYLPAIDELQSIFAAMATAGEKINKSLTDNNGQALSLEDYYWSSTDHGPVEAPAYRYVDNPDWGAEDYDYFPMPKEQELRVRCIRKF